MRAGCLALGRKILQLKAGFVENLRVVARDELRGSLLGRKPTLRKHVVQHEGVAIPVRYNRQPPAALHTATTALDSCYSCYNSNAPPNADMASRSTG